MNAGSQRFYRIVKARFVNSAWSGQGAAKFPGRWNNTGVSVIYVASSLALAALEMLAHLDTSSLLDSYRWAWIDVPDREIEHLNPKILPRNWRSNPAPPSTRNIGQDWIDRSSKVGLEVPSVVIPTESNLVLNPNHPRFAKLKRGTFRKLTLDPRLFKK